MNIYKLSMLWRRHRYDVAAWFERHSQNFVYAVLLIGFIVVIQVLRADHQKELDSASATGRAQGYEQRSIEIKTAWERGFETEACMSWWFSGDAQKVGKAIQKVQLK